jgi:hypothetical protein
MQASSVLDFDAIQTARSAIKGIALQTPIRECATLDDVVNRAVFGHGDAGCIRASKLRIFLKCENFQKAGSFKFRGAYHFLSKLSTTSLRAGLISYSTGTTSLKIDLKHAAEQIAQAIMPLASQQLRIKCQRESVFPFPCMLS